MSLSSLFAAASANFETHLSSVWPPDRMLPVKKSSQHKNHLQHQRVWLPAVCKYQTIFLFSRQASPGSFVLLSRSKCRWDKGKAGGGCAALLLSEFTVWMCRFHPAVISHRSECRVQVTSAMVPKVAVLVLQFKKGLFCKEHNRIGSLATWLWVQFQPGVLSGYGPKTWTLG